LGLILIGGPLLKLCTTALSSILKIDIFMIENEQLNTVGKPAWQESSKSSPSHVTFASFLMKN